MTKIAVQRRLAFTLVELLLVISIIALLAGLTMGVTGIASRTMRQKRMEGELHKLEADIENYHAKRRQYPPDNPGAPGLNQLFYELDGTIFSGGSAGAGLFTPIDGHDPLTTTQVQQIFHADGFANSSRDPQDPALFHAVFKTSQLLEVTNSWVSGSVHFMALMAPLKAPDGKSPSLWNYVSSQPTNNPSAGFDLWADVRIGSKTYRFCNWSDSPVLLP